VAEVDGEIITPSIKVGAEEGSEDGGGEREASKLTSISSEAEDAERRGSSERLRVDFLTGESLALAGGDCASLVDAAAELRVTMVEKKAKVTNSNRW